MPRSFATVRVPVDLARECDRLLHCAETLPVIGEDAKRARKALHDLQPSVFGAQPNSGVMCEVCDRPVPIERVLNAAMRGQTAAYDNDRCRETARKRRYRAS